MNITTDAGNNGSWE